MYTINEFESRAKLDQALTDQVAEILVSAVKLKGKASIAVSGGSTPKGFFTALSNMDLPWKQITVTLADERWVDITDDASNTKLVHENLLQNKALDANFFHIKQGDELTVEVLSDLNLAAGTTVLPFDVLILGMGEDGHTASLFPCSNEIHSALSRDAAPLLKVVPQTAPHERITFSYAYLAQSQNTFLHICGDSKKEVLEKALADSDTTQMPIRAFLHHESLATQVYWAE
ncbi:6-phosphogluconolactonase [Thalassotalea euphylliae]|uniref:6-phosphogluconolactonase n=1 Tax=Thalassotalea euphylliae TaxID=1655234 RepID=A0A3E0TZ01_9GAMM|nr:6-phosphogluconolactonase [Thalassotalea euphylliae]REL29603.1 6-phosphogluconolactonase [Thalassotalea euphylliae]